MSDSILSAGTLRPVGTEFPSDGSPLAMRYHIWAPLLLISSTLAADAQQQADELLERSGVRGGFVVHLGCGNGEVTAALHQSDSFQVHGLEQSAELVRDGRTRIAADGQYGNVSLMQFSGADLPYVDNMVNLLIADQPGEVQQQEMLRVVTPGGTLMLRQDDGSWQTIRKPRPDNIDDWSHYLHDPSGNAVAHDDVVGQPRHLQWVGSPRWSRHHDRMASMSALVSTGGRMFYIMDEGSRISIQLPSRWKLVARDAFNGTILWKRDIASWQDQLWPLKSGPSQLSRRLVSTETEVYSPLADDGPLTAMDAATGETIRTYADTDSTEEVLHLNGLLFVVVRKGAGEREQYAPANGRVGDQGLVAREFFWNEEPRVIMAFHAATGERLWAKQTRISPLTLAASGDYLCFHDGETLQALNQKSGELLWQTEPVTRRQQFTFNFGPRLVIYQDVVLYAGGDGRMVSVDAATGKRLWESEHPRSGYQSPQDLMVVDGLVWCAPTTSGGDSGVFTGRDPRTGDVRKEFAPDVDTYWFHHRCYISKATDNFLLPSRTGIEFVDFEKEHWDIHHWVRGGCLYGIMPCNGLTYTPPHNCACYPEAKLYGFNALAPAAPTRPIPTTVDEAGRLVRGPAWNTPLLSRTAAGGVDDWPMFRHDSGRSGTTRQDVPADPQEQWSARLGGRLTSPVIADGLVYVARTDEHTLYALNQKDGSEAWTWTATARIDSPPTISQGRAVFGCTDGWIYCLRAADGQLVWKYRAAPLDRRAMAFEQLESLWPVHGSVLIRENVVWAVAGRSNFLDGGLRLLRLNLADGIQLSETIMDETNPETGNNLQEKLQTLQMPVGLPDILVADDQFVYMKSQKFDFAGNRLEIGPVSGDFVGQGGAQQGEGVHLFAPMGFLDDSWFHRSYWVFGRNFAGGHGGYFQAGRFAPSGDIMVHGGGYVFGYGRKPEYFRWTTTMERQLFSAAPDPPEVPEGFVRKRNTRNNNASAGQFVGFGKSPKLDPTGKPVTVEAWMTTTAANGVVIARGGPAQGFSLAVENGRPVFHIRAGDQLTSVVGPRRIVGGWHHLVGTLNRDLTVTLYVDGKPAGSAKTTTLLTSDPAQGMEIGADNGSAVGNYKSPGQFTGIIDEVRLYYTETTDEAVAERFASDAELSPDPVLVVPFDDGTARDLSTGRNNGTLAGGQPAQGHSGQGMKFSGRKQNNAAGDKTDPAVAEAIARNSLVEPRWNTDIPIYARAMVLSGFHLFVAGPPDLIDEEETFEQLSKKEQQVHQLLETQDSALQGSQGGQLLTVNADTGAVENTISLPTLPAWDGMAAARGQLFLTTLDGQVLCFGK